MNRTKAPVFKIGHREITAVEHPLIIQNLDNGIRTFGRDRPFPRILDSDDPDECIPLFLRYNDPMCVPILSQNAPTNNILLKITVPKRTGRKRKRGSQDPFTHDDVPTATASASDASTGSIQSVSRNDDPVQLVRKLKDNDGKYQIEAVGEIRQTHRFRAVSDFHQSTSRTELISNFRDKVMSCDIEKIREFKLNPSRGWQPNQELVPPPTMASHHLPFNWGWHQASHIHEAQDATGAFGLVNNSKVEKTFTPYISFDGVTPMGPSCKPSQDPALLDLIEELKVALDERPVWTRRALANRVRDSPMVHVVRSAIQHVGYQFQGGPFRDAVVKYGLDPRTDPKYRIYQTFFFHFSQGSNKDRPENGPWQDSRSVYHLSKKNGMTPIPADSHIFDGKTISTDGKIWQICDIRVPILAKLVEEAPLQTHFEYVADGWFHNGTIAKFKAIMKSLICSIKVHRPLKDADFEPTLAFPDIVPGKKSKTLKVPTPDMRISDEELDEMVKKGVLNAKQSKEIQKAARYGTSFKSRVERLRPRVAGPRSKRATKRIKGPKPTIERKKSITDQPGLLTSFVASVTGPVFSPPVTDPMAPVLFGDTNQRPDDAAPAVIAEQGNNGMEDTRMEDGEDGAEEEEDHGGFGAGSNSDRESSDDEEDYDSDATDDVEFTRQNTLAVSEEKSFSMT